MGGGTQTGRGGGGGATKLIGVSRYARDLPYGKSKSDPSPPRGHTEGVGDSRPLRNAC